MRLRSLIHNLFPVACALVAVGTWAVAPAAAQHMDMHGHSADKPAKESAMGHSHEMAELHGGGVTMTPANHFEVLCTPKELRLYVYDAKQMPMRDLQGLKGKVTIERKTGEPMMMDMTYVKPDSAHGRTQGYLMASGDFSEAAKGMMKAMFDIQGLGMEPVQFKSSLALGEPAMYACPMHADVTGEDPGRCSKCGMNMVKMGDHGEHEHAGEAGMPMHHE